MKFIFWCEFPERIRWNKLKALAGLGISVYIAVKTKKQFDALESKLKKYGIKDVGAWLILQKKCGYWFSAFTEKKSIDKLEQFSGLNIKLDIEPPFPLGKKYNFLMLFKWLLRYCIKRPRNKEYLQERIASLQMKSTKVIFSTFPLPNFVLRRLGFPEALRENKEIKINYMFYSSIIPQVFRPLCKFYYKWFARRAMEKYGKGRVMFALGLIDHGIFGNEPAYKSVEELKQDVDFLKALGAEEIAIYSLEGLLDKQNMGEWLNIVSYH